MHDAGGHDRVGLRGEGGHSVGEAVAANRQPGQPGSGDGARDRDGGGDCAPRHGLERDGGDDGQEEARAQLVAAAPLRVRAAAVLEEPDHRQGTERDRDRATERRATARDDYADHRKW